MPIEREYISRNIVRSNSDVVIPRITSSYSIIPPVEGIPIPRIPSGISCQDIAIEPVVVTGIV